MRAVLFVSEHRIRTDVRVRCINISNTLDFSLYIRYIQIAEFQRKRSPLDREKRRIIFLSKYT